ncbi:hypothetical protein LCGC14_1358180 [marine sediment metagenome]|uniref:Uncharacterized protein n=1 Tax=marine sediment metagenome TaxID=412755 RepID=A0A0F9MP92_9ZZZZ
MLFKPTIGTALSGKIRGIVASHNAGGAYFRVLTIPTNPNTPQQQAVRNAVAGLTNQWNNVLTIAQRAEWELYADNVKITNRIGEQVNISGLAMFVRSNVARVQTGNPIVLDGPGIFNLGSYTPPTLTNASEATQTVDLNFETTTLADLWANEVGGFMFGYISRPQNPSINFFRGPYRVAFSIAGDPVAPASPATAGVPFPIVAGQRLFGRAVTCRADGRYSTSSFFFVLTGA